MVETSDHGDWSETVFDRFPRFCADSFNELSDTRTLLKFSPCLIILNVQYLILVFSLRKIR